MKTKTNTAFIIRLHYKKDDPKWLWRYSYFASMVLPKLLAQDDQDFDICIRANPWHKAQIEALSPKIKVFDVKKERKDFIKAGYEEKCKKYFVDFVYYEDLKDFRMYEIQIGIDSDDMILRTDFVTRVKNECRESKSSLHISFQPNIFHVPTLRNYRCDFKYGEYKGSPIFVLYQPQCSEEYRYVFAYEDSHLKLPKYMRRAIRIEGNYCSYSVHCHNASTGLNHNAQQILI